MTVDEYVQADALYRYLEAKIKDLEAAGRKPGMKWRNARAARDQRARELRAAFVDWKGPAR